MVFGLMNFALFQRLLGPIGYPPGRAESGQARFGAADIVHVLLIVAVGAGLVFLAVRLAPGIAATLPKRGVSLGVMAYWAGLAFVLIAATGLITRNSGAADARGESASESVAEAERRVPFTPADWQRIAVILIVAIFSIVFWMGFEQAGGTFTLFADAETDRSVPPFVQSITGGPTFPASLFQSINPLLIVVLAPLPLLVWTSLDRAGLRSTRPPRWGSA